MDWAYVEKGVAITLGLQLLLVAGLHFLVQPNRNRALLGLLCVLLGLWFTQEVLWEYWHDSPVLFLLIGAGKSIFAPAILLFYFKTLAESISGRYVVRFLLLPVVYYGLFVVVRLYFPDTFPTDSKRHHLFFSGFTLLIFWFYFVVTHRLFRQRLRSLLIDRAYRKAKVLFYGVYFFLLQIPVWNLLSDLRHQSMFINGWPWLKNPSWGRVVEWGEGFAYFYLHLLGLGLFLYALSELTIFRRYFLPNARVRRSVNPGEFEKTKQRINTFLLENGAYRNANLNLASMVGQLNLTTQEAQEYLKSIGADTFKDHLNRLRLEEFKRLVVDPDYRHYDLAGLAEKCGFSSRSTFFRLFKSYEGETPNSYRKRRVPNDSNRFDE